MEWIVVAVLVIIGILLLIMEFLVFPGVNVAGVVGMVCVGVGIYLGYYYFGSPTGHFILIAVALAGGGVTVYALRANTWKRLSLNTSIEGSVEGVDASIREGDTGVSVGRLAPMGKVRVGDAVVEAQSQSGYIGENSQVTVLKVYKNKIIVKLKTE